MAFDYQTFRQEFPYFQDEDAVVYLDNAATALKPQVLIDRTAEFYASAGSVHRSQYDAAQTAQYEQARTQVEEWLMQKINALLFGRRVQLTRLT